MWLLAYVPFYDLYGSFKLERQGICFFSVSKELAPRWAVSFLF